jgi:hypothetical protein
LFKNKLTKILNSGKVASTHGKQKQNMRTKTLFLTAVLGVAAAATSMADTFSVNVVGYVNVTLTNGFNLLGNPLVASNSAIGTVLPNVPEGSVLYKLKPNGTFNTDLYASGAWYDSISEAPSTTTLSPGEGFFLYSSVVSNITFVGEVKQGTNTVPLNAGFSLVSSVAPQGYELVGTNFPASVNFTHYKLVGGSYQISAYDPGLGWYDTTTESPRQVLAAPAQGFFIYNGASATNWTRTFNVN